ncbi:MAG: hypothetical protein NT008_04035 [Methylococcales bacterium]|nr:hypothetical protein [Methylococcales bacterium]
MSFKNRGLGRGLEALLIDVPASEDRPIAVKINLPSDVLNELEAINEVAESAEMTIRQERLAILAEALALKELMNEIEQQVRDF